MKTTDLFDFRFVDRTKEREILNNFFMNNSKKILWISGDSGLGKTTFFNYVYNDWSDYSLCYIDIKNNSDSVKIITDFILELEKNTEIGFLKLVKKRYKQFYDITKKTTKDITSEIFPDLSNIVSTILDLGYTAINMSQEQNHPLCLITDYIDSILVDKKLCVCIDNFSRCDVETAHVFFQIFKTFISKNYFRACILTTTNEMQDELQLEIQRNLEYNTIKITKLHEYIYFYQILDPIFSLKKFDKEDIEYIYNKCDGSPQRLTTLISKLLEKNAIDLNISQKAIIDKGILFSILQAENIHFKENDLSLSRKWFIFSCLCLAEVIDIEQLKEFCIYISKKLRIFKIFNEDTFDNVLSELIDNGMMKLHDCDSITYSHDAEYRDFREIFQASKLKGMFSQYAYEFIKNQPNFSEKQSLLCKHALEADIHGWEVMNFRLGKKLAKNSQYYDAQKIFSRLEQVFHKLHPMQILYIALNSYETGNYQLAIEQLQILDPEKLKWEKLKYCYYFCLGKSFNNVGKTEKGAHMLEKALDELPIDCEEYVQTSNVLHMYYFELPDKQDDSYKIFKNIQENYKMVYPNMWAKTMRGCHNFLSNEEALIILQEATDIIDDELEKAYIKTTMGFVYIKKNNIDLAIEKFEEACETIKRLKIHEYSYAANNLALCYMLDKKYAKAKSILLEALFWNRTDYGNLVLQIHLMICSVYLKDKETLDYYNYLCSYMENYSPTGAIINRKIYINLGIVSNKLGKPLAKEFFFEKAREFVEDTTSEWRFYKLTGQSEHYNKDCPVAKYQLVEDFEPWFLVYAHD